MSEFGSVLVGLWMRSPEEAAIMLRALEAGLRNIAAEDPDRPKLEDWRRQTMNLAGRSANEQWVGWTET